MRNGGAGTISATANVNPAAIYELYAQSKAESGQLKTESGRKAEVRSWTGGTPTDADDLQSKLNVVRDLFGKKHPMIPALKQAIAFYTNDRAWAKVRPPLVELTGEQARALAAELKAIDFAIA